MASLRQTPTTLSLQSNFLPSRRVGTNPMTLRLPAPRRGAAGVRMSATVAATYAAALADIAKSNNTLDSTSADIEKIEQVFADKQVLEFFSNPTVGIDKKRQFIDEISKSSALQPHTANFLNILIDARRVDAIKDIVKAFEAAYNKITGTETAVVSSVVQLESEHLAQIAKQVQKLTGAKNVRIKTVIDPSLVAGFTIRYGTGGSKYIDMSVKKQLEEIAAQENTFTIG
ncbi:ATP synthase delta chain, chloroplastic-like [Melia azedarach]|uniref:ATP synthase delta chain, chloroplastic-like n=1 Tax=Melia azedarach TaxID=155640 RepID=A0ACC1WQP9_MELAZ|nr:ATP synthase delta chain, chloroplastic-like [Melia azedarach]